MKSVRVAAAATLTRLVLLCVCFLAAISSAQSPATVTVFVNGATNASNSFLFGETNVVQITIIADPPADLILFTLDDSDPVAAGSPYSAPFLITNTVTIRAAAHYGPSDFSTSAPVFVELMKLFNLTALTAGGGSIVVSNGPGPFRSNSVVTLTATAYQDWSFSRWIGDANGTNTTINIQMDGDKAVEAVFDTGGHVVINGGPLKLVPDQGSGQLAYVQVAIGPAKAIAAGAGWRLDGQTNFSSSPNFTVGVPSNYVISVEFAPLAGWIVPSNETVSVTLGDVTNISVSYISGVAFLQVQLGPPEAVAAGAGWRLLGDTNSAFSSDPNRTYFVTVTNVTNGVSLEFKQIPGWSLPGSQTVAVMLGSVTNITALYSKIALSVSQVATNLNDRTFRATLSGGTGRVYSIVVSSNLLAALTNWTELLRVTNTTGPTNFTDPFPATNAQRYYRAKELP